MLTLTSPSHSLYRILCGWLNVNEFFELETRYIKEYNSYAAGYNMTFGGIGANGLATNIETRKRISKSLSGRTLSESLKKRAQSRKSAFADT